MPSRRAGLLLLAGGTLQVVASTHRALIKVEDQQSRSEDVDPDEYLWETLPGRCCFNQNADECDTCTVWSNPENFCHTSRENCELCGMSTYCEPPPPLLDANKICIGDSQVGRGCFDDLNTGYCQKSGALASCQVACRKTEHCEMVALYTDVERAGSCVLCRNLLEFEDSQGAAVRVYSVEHLDVGPPSPPGTIKDEEKHFSIINEPSPPPPPLPPPRPPKAPPPPLPAALGSKADTHIDCEFFEGMDFSVKQGIPDEETDLTASTEKHCCSLCGMRAGCTDFVFEPASKTCVLLPHVLEHQLEKKVNPSTIAGSVTITRMNMNHAACHYDVGSGYTGGTVGLGKPLPGQDKLATKQDCCDACEREPNCAKFTYEKYGGVCRMHSTIAEIYFTFGLMSGTLDERSDPPEKKASVMHSASTADASGEDLSAGVHDLPPTPPVFLFDVAPPPLPSPEGDAQSSQDVLAYVSLAAFGIMILAMLLCTYLFFATEIHSLIHKMTFGVFGRKTNDFLPMRAMPEPPHDTVSSRRLEIGLLQHGWAKVTVQTAHVTQKKEVEIAGCRTRDGLRALIADEFGHLLRGANLKNFTILAWAQDPRNGASWMLVSTASNMDLVCQCTAIKLVLNELIDTSELEVAFPSNNKARLTGKHREVPVLTNCEVRGESHRKKNNPPGFKKGFQRVCSDSPPPEGSDSDDEKPLCASEGTLTGTSKKGRHTKIEKKRNGHSDSIEDTEELMLPGSRVQLKGLVGKAEFNGRFGVVMSHDPSKGRYRVQVETDPDEPATEDNLSLLTDDQITANSQVSVNLMES